MAGTDSVVQELTRQGLCSVTLTLQVSLVLVRSGSWDSRVGVADGRRHADAFSVPPGFRVR